MCYYVNIKFLEVDRNRRDVHLFMDSFFWGGGFEVIFSLMSVIVIGMFIVVAVKGIGQWNKNNQSPRLTVPASVTAKRTNVSRHQHANAGDVTGAHGVFREPGILGLRDRMWGPGYKNLHKAVK